jgi:hypothetical protein
VAEGLHDDARAQSLYRQALAILPDRRELHLLLGNVLTGTGVANMGAVRACGLNTREAMEHYEKALPLEAAAEALAGCK